MNFLVEVGWARGSLVREYTVLLDPPVFLAEQSTEVGVTESATVAADDPSLPQRIERVESQELTEDELEAELAAVNAVIGAEETADGAGEPVAEAAVEPAPQEVDDLLIAAVEADDTGAASEPAIIATAAGQDDVQYTESVLEGVGTTEL